MIDIFDELDTPTDNDQPDVKQVQIDDTNEIDNQADDSTVIDETSKPSTEMHDVEKKSFEQTLGVDNKNKAPMLNRGLILGISVASFLFIFLFIFININKKTKGNVKKEEVNVAGRVYVPDFDQMAKDNYISALEGEDIPDIQDDTAFEESPSMEEIDAKIEGLNKDNQVGEAPVYQQQQNYTGGSGYSGKKRPDTRDNKMQKTISGIKGLTKNVSQDVNQEQFTGQQIPNLDNIDAYINQSKADLAQGLMQQQGMASAFLGGNQNLQNTRQSFYEKSFGGNNQGQFLPSLSLWQGTYIPAILLSGIDTSLPGAIVARVTRNVYSSLDGKFLLIPQGTLLFAEYNSSVGYEQKRVQIGWTAMIRPDGFYVQLANMPAVDGQGYSGIKGKVNTHFWAFLKGLCLVSAISVMDTDINRSAQSFTDPYSQGMIDKLQNPYQRIQDKIIDKALDIEPSIQIKQGTELNILVNQTLYLPPVVVPPVTQKYRR